MVTSLGRSGGTWLMHVLAHHPAVIVHRRYPYESRSAHYWMHLLKILTEPADHLSSAHPDYFFADPYRAGHNPFFSSAAAEITGLHEWFSGPYAERVAAFCQEATDAYYDRVASHQGQPDARYFAEKHVPHRTQWVVWELYPDGREILLVRDPRDMFASMVAFNEKRGFRAFGREDVESDEEWVRRLRLQALDLLEVQRSRGDRAAVVRYEDLVTRPEVALAVIFRYLDVDARDTTIENVLRRASARDRQLSYHRTSATAAASIGRWRGADRRLRRLMEGAFSDVVAELEYD